MPAYLSARTPRLGFLLMFLMLLGLLLPMAQAQTAGQVRYFPRPGYESRMVGGQFQGSSDNATWQTLYTVTATPSDTYTTAAITADPKMLRYLRYLSPDGGECNVAEIEFDSGTGASAVKLTGTPFGTLGSYNNSGNDFTKVFDGDTATFFDSQYASGSFVGIDQGASPTGAVGQVRYFPRPGQESRMVGGQFQGSPDNSTWTTLYTVTAAPSDVYTTATTSADPKTFRYLRYLAPDGSYGNVAEIEFDSGGVKLTGAAFGTPGSYANSGNDFTKVFDGDTTTFFDAPYPGNGDFAGIDQGSASVLTSIAVSPTSAALNTGGTQQFTATALDQNGNALSPQPAFTWSTSGVGTIGGSTGLYTAGSTPGSATVQATSGSVSGTASVTVTASGSQAQLLAINAGGGTVGSFAADTDYSGGSTDTVTSAITTSGVTSPAPQAVYQSERWGNFTYTLPGFTPGGSYTLRLHFAETYYGPGQPGGGGTGSRQFNVAINGTPVLNNFDIFAAAGGADIALVKSYPATADASGSITVAFTNGAADNAKISGMEVLAGAPATGGIIYGAPSGSQAAPDIPPPGWAEEVMPTDDSSDADGMGPSMGGPVNTASGVEENSPGADLWAYNPLGPSASYSRMYRSARALQGYHSPGLSAGWVDNYDQSITITGSTYTRVYPNGGQEAWGGTTGALTPPSGAPYTAVQTPAAGGKPAFITVTEKDRSQEIFTQIPTAAGPYPTGTYLLSQVKNLVGHSVFLNRDASGSAYRVLSITNDAATPLALLSFTYAPSGLLASVTDSISAANPAGIRQVAYTFTGGNLSAVSQIAAPGAAGLPTRWGYGYTPSPTNGQPLLIQVQAPNPASPGTLASTYTDYYDTGAVAEHIDATGRVKSYAYNGSQTQIQADNADGSLAQSWTQKQNTGSKNQDAGVVDAKGKATSIAYSGTPSPYLPSAETNRNGQTASVTYDPANSYGNVATVLSPRNVQVATTYQYPADFPLGQPASVQESILNGSSPGDTKQPTSFTYYGTGDVPTDGGPAGTINGLLKTVSSPQPDSTTASPGVPVTTTYSYDSLGNVTQMTGPNANGLMTVAYNYTSDGSFSQAEALGEPLTVTVSGPDAYGNTTTAITHYRYDMRGNRIAVIDPSGYETDFAYNLADQLTDTLYPATGDSGTGQSKTSIAYQYVGGPDSTTTVYDESGSVFRQVGNVYDAEGEVLSVQGNTYPVLNAYDGRGRVKSVTYYGQSMTNANTTYYDYDAVGNLADIRYPGQTGANFDELQYFYDDDSNLIEEIDGIGLEKDYQRFDPTSKLPDPESLLRTLHYVYPSGYTGKKIGDVAFAYDHYGRRASMTSLDIANQSPYITQKTYAYDDLDELSSLTTNFGYDSSNTGTGQRGLTGLSLTFQHYADGSRSTLSFNDGDSQQYLYDGLGRLTLTYLPYSNVGADYTYQANGWMTRRQTFYLPPNSNQTQPYLQADQTYNPRGFVTTLTNSLLANAIVGSSARMLSSFTGANPAATGAPRITYDPDGNRLQELATVPAYSSAPDLSRAVSYQYDSLDQLTQEVSQATSGTTALNYNNTFGYDLSGNPTTSSRLKGSNFNADNQNTTVLLTENSSSGTTYSSASISYNGNGDSLMLPYRPFGSFYDFGITPATYDPEDRLTDADNSYLRATYDGDGLRTWDFIGSAGVPSYHLFDGSTSVVEAASDQDNAELSFSLYGTDGLAGRLTQSDGYIAETYDPQGNAIQPVHLYSGKTGNTAQAVTSSFYDAFGQGGLYDTHGGFSFPADYNPVGFGGQYGYYHEYAGHYLLGHRFYDPDMGRFVTRDPIGYKGGINLYGFAGNNPVNESDPSGYAKVEIRYRRVAGIGPEQGPLQGYHAFIVVTDLDGSQYEVAGGPVGNPLGEYPIYVRHGEYKAKDKHGNRAYDWPLPGQKEADRPKPTVLVNDKKSAWFYMNRFITTGKELTDAHVPYIVAGPDDNNSNFAVKFIINNSGIGLKAPSKRPVWTPGWDSDWPAGYSPVYPPFNPTN